MADPNRREGRLTAAAVRAMNRDGRLLRYLADRTKPLPPLPASIRVNAPGISELNAYAFLHRRLGLRHRIRQWHWLFPVCAPCQFRVAGLFADDDDDRVTFSGPLVPLDAPPIDGAGRLGDAQGSGRG